MLKRFPLFIRHVMYNLRGGFLVRPLIIAVVLGLAGGLLAGLEQAAPAMSAWVPAWLFPSHSDSQVAQLILGGIAASVMTVVSIVFAILLMTLTLASMQFSPRIIVSFAKDRVTQWTLGIFLGTFLYCIAALPAAHNFPERFEPVVTVIGAMLLAVMCVAWLLFFIHHISQAISVNHIVDRIATETEAMIRDTMPEPALHKRLSITQVPPADPEGVDVLSGTSGYIRYIDANRLVALAKAHRITIQALRRVGHFVPSGIPLLKVSKEHKLTPELETELLAAFDIGPTRTLQQDVEFGILQIVDIALKAISPAVNDPTTAVSCVDQLSRILICFASREPIDLAYYDPPGVLRVSIPWLGLDRLIDSAFEQIRMYSKGDVAVSLRLLRALGDIGATVPDRRVRELLAERGRRVVTGAAATVGDSEVTEMLLRLTALEALASQGS